MCKPPVGLGANRNRTLFSIGGKDNYKILYSVRILLRENVAKCYAKRRFSRVGQAKILPGGGIYFKNKE